MVSNKKVIDYKVIIKCKYGRYNNLAKPPLDI